MSIESVVPSNHLILSHPLFILLSIFPSIRVFSNVLSLPIRWPKYWSLSFSISPSNEYSGLISFRINWFDLFTVQGTQESSPSPQFESISSVLSLLYGPTLTSIHDYWKNYSFDYIDLCQKSDVSAFQYAILVCHSFPSKEQVSFNCMAAVTICSDFGAQENKVCHCFHCFPSDICYEVMGPDAIIFAFLNVEFVSFFHFKPVVFRLQLAGLLKQS